MIIKKILKSHRANIHGMVHCSGGAQTKVLHFVDGVHVIKDNLFPVPLHGHDYGCYWWLHGICIPYAISLSW